MATKRKENWNYIFYATIILVYGPLGIHGERNSKVTPPEMIAKEGFPVETHLVTTADGYIVSVNRIPGPPGSTPVLMLHGLFGSSALWLYNGKNGSLAFLLHQMGYDVWLGNFRGNTYSKMHKTLSPNKPSYWNFSWDQLAAYDTADMISYVYNKTSQKLFYVGHSLGCITFTAMAAERQDITRNVKAMFALAPAVYGTHDIAPLFKLPSYFWKQILFFSNLLGIHEVLGRNAILNFASDYLCPRPLIKTLLCENFMFSLTGFNRPEWPKDLAPKLYGNFPAGSSIRTFVHYMQQEQLAKFRRFDYPSKKKNMKVYGTPEPPEYNISRIETPIAVFYSHNDWLVGAKDAERYYEQITNKLGFYAVEPYNHLDFQTGLHAPERVYSTIFKLMSQFN